MQRQKSIQLNGLLPVDKPKGMVSKDVSRWLEDRLGKVKMGHVGTLDPGATGVLPILLGRATRLQDYLLNLPKTYEFDIRFGIETETLDLDGEVVKEASFDLVNTGRIRDVLPRFVGKVSQVPPIYSAVKYRGKPLYKYARSDKSQDVPLAKLRRDVYINKLELLSYQEGVGTLQVECSRGTYVRSLIKDLTQSLGTCGTLARLVRLSAGGVRLAAAYTLDDLERSLADIAHLVVPVEAMNLGIPRWHAPEPTLVAKLRRGQPIAVNRDLFASGVREEACAKRPSQWARPLVLINNEGKAFGMGAARGHDSGKVLISMKRGL